MGRCTVHGHNDDIFTYVGYILYGDVDFVPRRGQLMKGDTDRLDLKFFIDGTIRIQSSSRSAKDKNVSLWATTISTGI